MEPSWRGVRAEPGLQPPLGFPAAAAFPYPIKKIKTAEKGSKKLTSDGVNGTVFKKKGFLMLQLQGHLKATL